MDNKEKNLVKYLERFLKDPENHMGPNMVSSPSGANYLRTSICLDKRKELTYICFNSFCRTKAQFYNISGILTDEKGRGDLISFLPLSYFKPEYRKQILKQIATSDEFADLVRLTKLTQNKLTQNLIGIIESESSGKYGKKRTK